MIRGFGGWTETFAPIVTLKKQFLSNYPSEVLTPETSPSSRVLSQVFWMNALLTEAGPRNRIEKSNHSRSAECGRQSQNWWLSVAGV